MSSRLPIGGVCSTFRAARSFVDIGGSTGGFVRIVLDDWKPPDLAAFDGDLRPSDSEA